MRDVRGVGDGLDVVATYVIGLEAIVGDGFWLLEGRWGRPWYGRWIKSGSVGQVKRGCLAGACALRKDRVWAIRKVRE